MRNESIDAISDDYKRGRLQALQDLIERLDNACGESREEMKPLPSGEENTVEALYVRIQNAVLKERIRGMIAATQIAVDMFSSEAGMRDKKRADEDGTR